MANNARLIGPIFTVLGSVFAAIGIYLVLDAVDFAGKANETMGEVVSVQTQYSTDSDGNRTVSYLPTIAFQSRDGQTHQAETHISSSEYDYQIGALVEILYDPEDLVEVRINSFWSLYLLPGGFTVTGSMFAVIGVLVWLRRVRAVSASSPSSSRTVKRDRDI